MKKIILLALITLMMVGCIEIAKKVQHTTNTTIQEWHNQIVIIDSCEYISEETRGLIEHKGNCRFCEERRQKELEVLVTKLRDK